MTEKPTIHELEAILDDDSAGTVSIQPDGSVRATTLLEDIRDAINRHSAENASNTPDFILAQYLNHCLIGFNLAVNSREIWYGRHPVDTAGPSQPATPETEADPHIAVNPGHEIAGYTSPPTT